MQAKTMPFSVYGVPLLGLTGLLVCLWHPQMSLDVPSGQPQTAHSDMVYLVQPRPRLDKSMTVFLKQEAKDVAYSRQHDSPAAQTKIIADYNLIAEECSPAVFAKTHLPAYM